MRVLNDAIMGSSEHSEADMMALQPQPVPVSAEAIVTAGEFPSATTVWSTLPRHLPPSCPLDHVVTNLVNSRRPYDNIQEFQRRAFPSVQSLLNPTYEAIKSPVTSAIVKNIINVMTVPTLPEQIAILFVMSTVVRWQISPTQSNYDGMPQWLRPTPAQLIHPHSVWLDLFPWPMARERMCLEQKYQDQHHIMSRICNESISINWPHQPSDMMMTINGTDTILNPIFERHIRNLKNWTVGQRILEV